MYWNLTFLRLLAKSPRWIVTLDVLKYAKSINNLCAILLNSNIRCIEIRWSWNNYRIFCPLNSNIRCIEIHIQLQCANSPGGWIVTLDVLKWYDRWSCWNNEFRLNSNIRCIEIYSDRRQIRRIMCWIVTLDVLKYSPYELYRIGDKLNSNIRCIEIKKWLTRNNINDVEW